MIHAVLLGREPDMLMLEQEIRREAALDTDERVSIEKLRNGDALACFLKKKEEAELICVDVSLTYGIKYAEQLRESYPKAAFIVIADTKLSPVAYLKPDIMAAALLLKPLRAEAAASVICGVFRRFIQMPDTQEIFVVENREERQRIPYTKLLYFEARRKKVYACTENAEYGFYDTIDHLEKALSEHFVRCHRSYLVNRELIEGVKLSQNCLFLKGNIVIPLSRSWKENIKELIV